MLPEGAEQNDPSYLKGNKILNSFCCGNVITILCINSHAKRTAQVPPSKWSSASVADFS